MARNRSQSGVSLVDLIISVLIMTFVSTAIFGLLVGTGALSQKVSNKIDSVNAARNTLEKIGKDVRMGRSLGDVFGSQIQLQPASGTIPAIMGVEGSDSFPSTLNPLYGGGQSPSQGGWPWTGPPYKLDGRTLVVQIPIFDSNGFPTSIPANFGAPATTSVQDNVETHIYRVVPDPDAINHPGEFILQISRIAGNAGAGYNPGTIMSKPQTILTGIVGPFDDTGELRIFQYLDKTDDTGAAEAQIITPAMVANYTGVIINVEILKHAEGRVRPQALAVKTEVFLRNNALATTVGQPTTVN